jgi:uncharacterized protein (TIGR03382 family)
VLPALSRLLASAEDQLYWLFVADSKRAYRRALLAVGAIVAGTSGLMVIGGAVPQRTNGQDSLFILDYAWRLMCGQRPHTDYYDFIGPGALLPPVVGMAIGGCNCNALAYGPALLMPLIAAATWWLARRRFPAFSAALVTAMVAGLTVGQYALGLTEGWRDTGYWMCYNRFQWSLLCMTALAWWLEPRVPPARGTSMLEGFLVGVLAGLLLAGKPNFAAAAVVILAGGAVLRRQSAMVWSAALAGLAAFLLPYLAYLRGDLAAWQRDLAMLAGVQRSGHRVRVVVHIFQLAAAEFGFVCLIGAVHMRRILGAGRPSGAAKSFIKALAAALLLGGLGVVVTSANMQYYDIPLCALAAALLAETTRRLAAPAAHADRQTDCGHVESYRLRVSLSCLAAAILVLGFAVPDFASVAYAYSWKYRRESQMPSDARIAAPPLKDMVLTPTTYKAAEIEAIRAKLPTKLDAANDPYSTALLFNDGLSLLRGRVNQDSRVMALWLLDPFPFALQLPPPRGVPTAWRVGYLVDDAHFPSDEVLFHEVTHLMICTLPGENESMSFLHKKYDAYIADHFTVAAESRMWKLLVRKESAAKNP